MAILKQIPIDRIIKGNKGLAALLKVDACTISRWKKSGRLNYKEVNGIIFYDCENIFAEQPKQSNRKQNA